MPRPLVATVPAPTGGGLRPRRSPCQPASRAQVPAPLPTSGLPALRVPGDQPLEIVCLKAETLATRGSCLAGLQPMCAYPLRVPNTAGKPSDALTFPWPFQARQRAKRLRLWSSLHLAI
ncbi:uncharacterized protein LOC116901807 [Rattus rattus]|uniref:uncharacterized protein LOC116901807 n=1 Tax=Rattus rattus TaxID=10117 RepID=UPI0013F2D8B5|nr:uncharacterized protein LOC116901807 [Rattus rattus]